MYWTPTAGIFLGPKNRYNDCAFGLNRYTTHLRRKLRLIYDSSSGLEILVSFLQALGSPDGWAAIRLV